jgi:hypothetical protein
MAAADTPAGRTSARLVLGFSPKGLGDLLGRSKRQRVIQRFMVLSRG